MKKKKIYSLRELRENSEMTIQDLAEKTGIPYGTLQAIESGRGKGFNVVMKHKIADYFRVSLFALFPEEREHLELIVGKGRKVQVQEFLSSEEAKNE